MSEFIHPDVREKKTLTDLEGNIKYFYTHNGRPRRQRERGELKTIRRNNGRKLYRFDEKKNICGYQATQPTPSGKIQKEPQRDTS